MRKKVMREYCLRQRKRAEILSRFLLTPCDQRALVLLMIHIHNKGLKGIYKVQCKIGNCRKQLMKFKYVGICIVQLVFLSQFCIENSEIWIHKIQWRKAKLIFPKYALGSNLNFPITLHLKGVKDFVLPISPFCFSFPNSKIWFSKNFYINLFAFLQWFCEYILFSN